MSIAFIQGFLLGGGLIVAIGAQNAFILRQGLLRRHVFVLCLVAAICDALLILLGVLGMGALVEANPALLFWVTLGGAIFLTAYALFAMRRMLFPEALEAADSEGISLKRGLAILFAFTFLNPHVYIDTVVLVGGIASQYAGAARWAFTVGAMVASFVWFFTLGYGARVLTPLFAKPIAWRVLDGIIAIVMAAIAISLYSRAWAG